MKEGSRTIAELSVQGKKGFWCFRSAKSHLPNARFMRKTPGLTSWTAFTPCMCAVKNSRLPHSVRGDMCGWSVGPCISCQGVSGTRGQRGEADCVAAQDKASGEDCCLNGLLEGKVHSLALQTFFNMILSIRCVPWHCLTHNLSGIWWTQWWTLSEGGADHSGKLA